MKAKLSTLQTKADTLASRYIRQKFADHAGYVTCVSCQKVLPWNEAHCAHWVSRSAKATRWLEENLAVACVSCNCYRPEMHLREYTLYQLDRYGREGIDEIRALSKKVLSASQVRQLAEEAIEYFGSALKEMDAK